MKKSSRHVSGNYLSECSRDIGNWPADESRGHREKCRARMHAAACSCLSGKGRALQLHEQVSKITAEA